MTFCLAMKVRDGLVGISDTRITSGNECITASKLTIHQSDGHAMFIMTSGLRAVRDKTLTYFNEMLEDRGQSFNKLYKAVNAFAEQVRRVNKEDGKSLLASGFRFNINALVGGQLENDTEHKLYMLYPEGNWIEVGETSPFYIIGSQSYGKPLLNRVLRYDSSMQYALKAGFYSFDSTRKCANDVYYPIDVVLYKRDTFSMVTHRYSQNQLSPYAMMWQDSIAKVMSDLPEEWLDNVFSKLNDLQNGNTGG